LKERNYLERRRHSSDSRRGLSIIMIAQHPPRHRLSSGGHRSYSQIYGKSFSDFPLIEASASGSADHHQSPGILQRRRSSSMSSANSSRSRRSQSQLDALDELMDDDVSTSSISKSKIVGVVVMVTFGVVGGLTLVV